MFFNLQESLSQLDERSGKKSGISVQDYLTADDDLMVCAGVADEDILCEITGEIENNDGEDDDDDTGPSKSLLSSKEALQSVKSLRTFFQAFRRQMKIIFVH